MTSPSQRKKSQQDRVQRDPILQGHVIDAVRSLRTERLTQFFASSGPLVSGTPLWTALGYQSGEALRQARQRNTVPVQTFKIPGRRGVFAYTHELICYLVDLGGAAPTPRDTSHNAEESA